MCGFVALFQNSRRPVDPALLDRMTDSIAHRGPDGRGVLLAPGCGLGHRRLAIIDLEGGIQPLQGRDPRVSIVFNGEAYNYQALFPDLPGPWRTQSDTEVFLRVYEERGIDGLRDVVGMWGAAIWDGRSEQLVVVRDRLGVKPVYYAQTSDGYVFASEIRALLEHPEVSRTLDPIALDQLLTYRFVPAPRTLFVSVKKLPPGHVAIVRNKHFELRRYWNPTTAQQRWTEEEAVEVFSATFDDSVRLRMVSDVPVGLFLSGGLDSAAILHSMKRRDVHTFTVSFAGGDTQDNEIPLALKTAEHFGAVHHAITIGPDDYAGYLDQYARQLEEPLLNDSAIATHFLSQLARRHVKVVLSGQGADEPLAGYDRYKGELVASLFGRLRFPALRASQLSAWPFAHSMPEKAKRALMSLGEHDPVRRAVRMYAVFQEEEKAQLLRTALRSSGRPDVAAPIRAKHDEVNSLSPLGRMLYTDTRVWLPDELLLIADKLSMAHGLELRVPFVDHRLVELVESFPDALKIRLGRRGFETKRVHRRAMANRLPAEILTRKKLGFTNPMDRWLRQSLRTTLEARLLRGDTPLAQWFEPDALTTIVREHLSGRSNRRRALFLLLTIDAWARAFGVSA
ncbi:MAG: asparagine synthase (glutamine-hydrolyzing) [Deltaproteobacteria bacterium]|nr:asparagine synthase (glutamine-hydrolyzing) [Deltaproteobacteria bacterium]